MNKEKIIEGINRKTRKLLLQYHPDKNRNQSEEKKKVNQEKFNAIIAAKEKLLEFLKYEDDYNSKVNLFYSRYILILLVLILLVIVCCRLLFVSKHVVYKIIYIVLFDKISFDVLNTLRQFYNKIPNILGKMLENKDDYPLFQ
jgi:preprotein translocase subunit Sec63